MKRSSCASGSGQVPSCSIGFWVATTTKRIVELAGLAKHRHLPLGHRLQQRALGARRGAVDFVGQQQLREKRASHEAQFAAAFGFLQQFRAQNIGGHQVRRELDAAEIHAHCACQRAHEQRFGKARHAGHQHMAAAEHRHLQQANGFVLADDDLVQRPLQAVPAGGQGVESFKIGLASWREDNASGERKAQMQGLRAYHAPCPHALSRPLAPTRPVIGITMGDPAGVGPEVIVKALADPAIAKLARFVIFGCNTHLEWAAEKTRIEPFWYL